MKFLNATRQEHRLDLKKKMNRRPFGPVGNAEKKVGGPIMRNF